MAETPMTLRAVVKSMRPAQWTKNLFVFAALIFSQQFFAAPLLLKTGGAFLSFCLVSGAFYIFNDLQDREEDRAHPKKSQRPIARGEINSAQALALFGALAAVGLALALYLGRGFFLAVVVYFFLQIAYSLRLKQVVILDIFVIAAGFVIRVVAGSSSARRSWRFSCRWGRDATSSCSSRTRPPNTVPSSRSTAPTCSTR
jgi:4-hydroxybenzoate polyprenyltransferase